MSYPGDSVRIVDVATWTVIGLLTATFVGGFYYLGSRIDALGSRLDARIDALGARLDGRVDNQGARIDGLSQSITELTAAVRALTTRFDTHLERHAG